MKLFDEIERIFDGPALYNENTYRYFQNSIRKDISIIRDTLNDWFSSYPDSEKKELKCSFEKHFDDSFFELFLFHLFEKLGFTVVVHPKISNFAK